MIGIFLLATVVCAAQQPEVTAEQFSRLIQARHEKVKDFSLTYEGSVVWTGPSSLLGKPIDQFGDRFQGFDFYRTQDAAELTEVYSSSHTVPATIHISKKTHLKGRSQNLSLSPDQKKVNLGVGIIDGKGGPGSLSGPDSPHALIFYWYFDRILDPVEKGYRFDGWEDVDGHLCLRVQFNTKAAREPSTENYQRFWIDMERGGHPLRVERYRKGQLAGRTDRIQLREVTQPGGPPVWFPYVGVLEGFEWEDVFYAKPVLREEIAIVNGSIRLNQGLDDSVFKIPPPGRTVSAEVARQERSGAAMELPDRFAKTEPAPPRRTDPKSVRDRLHQQLADAVSQARELEAPSVARGSAWTGTVLVQATLGMVGLILCGVGLKWRSLQ